MDLNNGIYCDLRNKSVCLNTVLLSQYVLSQSVCGVAVLSLNFKHFVNQIHTFVFQAQKKK